MQSMSMVGQAVSTQKSMHFFTSMGLCMICCDVAFALKDRITSLSARMIFGEALLMIAISGEYNSGVECSGEPPPASSPSSSKKRYRSSICEVGFQYYSYVEGELSKGHNRQCQHVHDPTWPSVAKGNFTAVAAAFAPASPAPGTRLVSLDTGERLSQKSEFRKPMYC